MSVKLLQKKSLLELQEGKVKIIGIMPLSDRGI